MVELERHEPSPSASAAGEAAPEFLAVLAHELRNPLAPIRNGTELLRSICSDPRQILVVEMISRQVVQLTRLLDDLLDAARARRGLLSIQKQTVDVGDIVAGALEAIQPAIDARRQNLLVSLPAEPVKMDCDPVRLTQVLQNLLDNANRYTPDGGTLSLKAEVNGDALTLEVSDDGEGIDPALLPRLFNVFAQGEQPLERPRGGLGLGLAIARNIVEMHGGTLSAHSDGPGRGSQFTLRLPIQRAIQGAGVGIDPTAVVQSGVLPRVLVIDDNTLVATSLQDCLGERGYDVVTASSGEAGLLTAEQFQPEVAILDIGLPGIDGFETARRLRARFPQMVLIGVSGYSWGMLRDADPAVFARYLTKPADPEAIAATIEDELHKVRAQTRSQAT